MWHPWGGGIVVSASITIVLDSCELVQLSTKYEMGHAAVTRGQLRMRMGAGSAPARLGRTLGPQHIYSPQACAQIIPMENEVGLRSGRPWVKMGNPVASWCAGHAGDVGCADHTDGERGGPRVVGLQS